MDIENASATACSECSTSGTLVKLTEVLDNMRVEYTIEPHAAA